MCIRRNIEECTFGSTIDHGEIRGTILAVTASDVVVNTETGTVSIPFGTEVTSHYLSPLERRRLGHNGPGPCEVWFSPPWR
jgi:hypothetical protein